MAEGKVRIYLDDKKVVEWTEISDATVGNPNTEGTVGLLSPEGWGEFDNLIVRGTVANSGEEDTTVTLEPGAYTDNFDDETANVSKDPSHWIEATTEDKWTVVENAGGLAYSSNGATVGTTKTWLHVFETDVDYTVDIKIDYFGYYPIFGLVARDNATDSYIKAGYDATYKKWFIKVRLGVDFAETAVYSDTIAELTEGDSVKLRLLAEGRNLALYVNGAETPVVTADAGQKVMAGRVGVYTERCDITFDNVELKLLSGQGRVNDGVLEYYAKENGITTSLHQFLELPDGNILCLSEGNKWISYDGGKTFEMAGNYAIYGSNQIKLPAGLKFTVGEKEVDTDKGVYIGIQSIKPDRTQYPDWTTYQAFLYTDDLSVKTSLGVLPTAFNTYYAQPGDHMNIVSMGNGNYRIFFTAGRQSGLEAGRAVISETYYSDDFGQTWHASSNSPQDFTNLKNWCETKVIKINKDVTDYAGNTITAGTMIQYCSYNTSEFMRYSLSYDGGVTWEGDYVMPTIPTCLGSFSVEEDPYEPGTYYMSTIYNYPYTIGNGRPRHRIALLRSYDGFNWEYLADVDRWGDVSDGGRAEIMQNVNMYIDITKDYVFPSFSRSEQYENNSSGHNKQLGRVYRFEKSKLEAYDEWPAEYYISPKTIFFIEGADVEVALNSAYPAANTTFKVHYYDGTYDEIPLSEAYYTAVDTTALGEQEVVLDYGVYRDIFTVKIVLGDAPALNVADGKTYCIEKGVVVFVVNGDLDSVTLNGQAVTLTDGKFTVSAKDGVQTIVATDKAGNSTTIAITVNAAHTGGTATCKAKAVCSVCNAAYGELAAHKGGTATCDAKAKCEVCGESYGELNADKHTKEAKWTTTADKHSKAYECCGKVVVAEEAHEWKNGKCEECGYEAKVGTQQKPIEIPADKDTVKEEAKVEANEEKHYELDEALAGKTITVKGEGAYIVVDGKKYEAVNGVVEVKLPTKTGKISVVIGNAGTKAGSFNITIATPSQDNSDTGDNAAIALFGGLMALSILAAAALLIPDIRKKLMK